MNHYVCVIGGRDNTDVDPVAEALNFLHAFYREQLRVMHGAAPGVDSSADAVCKALGVTVKDFPAEWTTHGKAAGAIRNAAMVKYMLWCMGLGHTAQVLAFAGGKGTGDMMSKAEDAGIDVCRWGW